MAPEDTSNDVQENKACKGKLILVSWQCFRVLEKAQINRLYKLIQDFKHSGVDYNSQLMRE